MEIPKSLYTAMRFNFLYVDKYFFKQGWVYPESYVPYCMVRYILKGSAVFIIDGTQYIVHPDEVAYIPNGCMLECYSLDNDLEFISIRFVTTVQLNGGDYLEEFFHVPPVTPAAHSGLLPHFQEVYQNATSKNSGRLFRIRGNLELIIALLVEQQETGAPEQSDAPDNAAPDEGDTDFFTIERIYHREKRSLTIKRDPRIQTVVEYLISHPTERLSISYLCEIAQMSPSSLRRHFKEHTGKTPGDFIKELRIMVAARQLLATDKRISSIAYDLGFTDQNYFSRKFKQVFGISPSQYRASSSE